MHHSTIRRLRFVIMLLVASLLIWNAVLLPQSVSAQDQTPKAGSVVIDDKGTIMRYVPAGSFLMGTTEADMKVAMKQFILDGHVTITVASLGEEPQTTITIPDAFLIDQTDVTNAAYAQFMDDGGYAQDQWWTEAGRQWKARSEGPNDGVNFTSAQQPRVGVTWYEAYAYCAWRGGRLPTEAEWEYAARGTDGRIYPWGNMFNPNNAVYGGNSNYRSAPVGSKPDGASWVGALDMSGNVWQWTSSLFMPYPYNSKDGRENPSGANLGGVTNLRVTRGGSWRYFPMYLRTAYRGRLDPVSEFYVVGFRCARSL